MTDKNRQSGWLGSILGRLAGKTEQDGGPHPTAKPAEPMTDEWFWRLVEAARERSGGSVELQAQALSAALRRMSPDQIAGFDHAFRGKMAQSYTDHLWAAAYIIQGGCSDDSFDYFRGWLIAQGQRIYTDALGDPETLIETIGDCDEEHRDGEPMLYVAAESYEFVAGRKLELTAIPQPSVTPSWNDDSVYALFPKLAEACG